MSDKDKKEERIKSFKEFWPYYLNEHSKPATRAMHLAGTAGAIALLGAAVVTGQWWLPAAAVAAGYGSAWTAHAFVEKNKPATFKYPLWSLMGDFKMLGHYVTGTLQREVDKHVAKKPEASAPAVSRPASGPTLTQRMKGLATRFKNAVMPKAKQEPKPEPPKPAPPAPAP